MKKRRPAPKHLVTQEATFFINGLFQEFQEQVKKYLDLTGTLLHLEARIELTEKTLCLTRDHLAMTIGQVDSAAPMNWEPTFRSVRFVGVRLVDACMTLLQERRKMTPEELLDGLNTGMFRFRTSSPLREIHAALLSQKRATKIGDKWVWAGGEQQISMRLRVVDAITPLALTKAEEG